MVPVQSPVKLHGHRRSLIRSTDMIVGKGGFKEAVVLQKSLDTSSIPYHSVLDRQTTTSSNRTCSESKLEVSS